MLNLFFKSRGVDKVIILAVDFSRAHSAGRVRDDVLELGVIQEQGPNQSGFPGSGGCGDDDRFI